jgi:signal transduction histidine kinase/CheY-like chemotaxis protein
MIGRTIQEVFVTGSNPLHEDACRRGLAGEHAIYEMSLGLATGTRHLQVSVTPLRVGGDEVTGLLLVGRDVTTVKRAELELRERDDRLQEIERVESLGRLAGGVAHDFNNLLTIINGYCELMLDGTTLSEGDARKVKEIAKAGERAAGLTGQLLAFGRRQVLQPRIIDLNDTVRETTTMLGRLIGEDVSLETRLDPELGKVQADPGQIGQVIMNLAVNARDAMPAGGRLLIETANCEVSPEYARWHTELHLGPYVQLTISDTGSGMDKTTQARAFEPFFTTKEKGKGTGLGLSTVYGIVRQSGGDILLYSEPGRGTSLKIFLPRVASPTDAVAPVVAPVTDSFRGQETILVAEDEAVIRQLARQVLETNGYTVIEAEDGLAALRIFQQSKCPIDLLLTDVVMPHLGGTELVRHLRDTGSRIKVLYMSGYTGMFFEELGKSDPGSGFLQKPFQPAALLKMVRQLLSSSTVPA